MSSPSNNRYQSRLFNLIRKQSRFFSDLFGLRTRQLKVATSWSVEAMLYPIYKLWQTTVEFSRKQLPSDEPENHSHSSKLETNSSTPTPPSVDMAVLRVKKVVENLQLEKIQKGESEFVDSAIIRNAEAIPVRGIASRISGSTSGASDVGQLVLVTAKNEILDILTLQQQQKLQNVIITEVANYWEVRRLSDIEKPQPFLLRISRLFKNLTSGKSKTKALNQASTDITPTEIKKTANKHTTSLSSDNKLFAFDAAIARVESNTLVPVSQATLVFQKRSSQLVLSMKTKFDMFFNGQKKVPNKAHNSVSTDGGETQFTQVQNLIQAALNYFFGKSDENKVNQLETASNHTSSLPGNVSHEEVDEISRTPQKNNENINKDKQTAASCASQSESWLELHDIFSESQTVQDPNSVASFLNPETETPPATNLFQKIINIFQGEEYSDPKRHYWIAKSKTVDTEENSTQTELKADPSPTKDAYSAFTTVDNLRRRTDDTQTSEGSVIHSFDASSRIATTVDRETSSGQIVHQPSDSNWDIEQDPDYFETQGKVVGYEKNPLERVLHCLDSALLKLEDIFARIVSLLQMLLRKL